MPAIYILPFYKLMIKELDFMTINSDKQESAAIVSLSYKNMIYIHIKDSRKNGKGGGGVGGGGGKKSHLPNYTCRHAYATGTAF